MGCRCIKNNLYEENNEIKSDPKETVKPIIKSNEKVLFQNNNKDQNIGENIDKYYEKSDNDSYSKVEKISNSILNSNYSEKSIEYNNTLLNIINKIRENPFLYANEIEKSKKNIEIKKNIIKDERTGLVKKN